MLLIVNPMVSLRRSLPLPSRERVELLALRLRCLRTVASTPLDLEDPRRFEIRVPNWSISNSSDVRFFALRDDGCVNAVGGEDGESDPEALTSGTNGREGRCSSVRVTSDHSFWGNSENGAFKLRGYKISSPPLSSAIEGRLRRGREMNLTSNT